ncbi:MAG: TRAP transporter large permease [Acetivibrionales bacterium]|jgi:tripartite ATP-independent transporter DctM subunit
MSLSVTLFLASFFLLLLIGAPTYLCLLAGSLVYFFFHPEISSMMIMQKMYGSLDSFVLLAVPLFMISGNLMNRGGITERIFSFAKSMVGHMRGGLGHVNVLASFIFSGMSGSALADVGGLGQVEIAAMKAESYEDDIILGITAASSTMGPIVPPSIPMVVYGAIASISVGGLFIGGVLPGVIMLITLCCTVYVVAHKRQYPVQARCTWKERWHSLQRSFLALLMPFVTMGGIWTGWFTPTEAALISIVYVTIVMMLVYKELNPKEIIEVFYETAAGFVPALTIVVASSLFGWVLQFERIDKMLIELFFSITDNKYIILLFLNILLLFCGMILDSTPVILLFVPLFLPLGKELGVHEIQMGVIVVLNLMIGLMTPPIGQSLFILSSVTGNSFEYVVKCTYKWLLPLLIVLLLVTYVSGVTMWLPTLMGLA